MKTDSYKSREQRGRRLYSRQLVVYPTNDRTDVRAWYTIILFIYVSYEQ